MKSILFYSILALATQALAVQNLVCEERRGNPDSGYAVYFTADMRGAQVDEMTFGGPVTKAKLACSLAPAGRHRGNDMIQTYATCREQYIADAGYSVVVEHGGFAGLITATLFEVSFAGSKPIADLICALK